VKVVVPVEGSRWIKTLPPLALGLSLVLQVTATPANANVPLVKLNGITQLFHLYLLPE
jgi:hypothetical protein